MTDTCGHGPSHHGSSDRPSNGRMALVVDDNPIARMAMKCFLEMQGLVVITACDGLEAVSKAIQHPFSLIVTDIEMPLLNGLDSTKAIRMHGGRLAEIPIIACTGSSDLDGDTAKAAGIDLVVRKGGDPTPLRQLLGRFGLISVT